MQNDRIEIDAEGQSIAATLFAPAKLVPGVLFVHGWNGSQERDLSRAHEISRLGCLCLTFDLRGHAKSEQQRETVTRQDNLCDVLAAYDRLASIPGVDRSAIAVIGSSYGGYLAAFLTRLRPVKWLALRVPAIYRDRDWEVPKAKLDKRDLADYRHTSITVEDNSVLQACAEFRGDVLIVESERDNLVPHPTIASYIASFRQAQSLTHRMIKGADHGLSAESCQKAYTSLLVNWMTEMVFGARQSE